ncbi:MAG: hypothetical protein ACYS8W_21775 [Planctomycetota bacterium]|jgi:hypothetical protein
MEVVLVIIGIIVVVGIAILSWYYAEQRRKALAAWARSLGLRFSRRKDWGIDSRYPFSCLEQGDERYGFNITSGYLDERHICAFDYHYETYSTDSDGNTETHHHYFSAFVIDSNLPLKQLAIRPEGLWDKFTEFFGFDDIDFESAEFSRKFHVKSPDRRWAYDVISQETMEFLLHAPRFRIEMAHGYVIVYRSGTFSPREFDAARYVGEGILDRLPRYLLRELKGVD